ncbi:unnamed protein product [Rotaria socialis]|uniref:SAGA-associated factor 11 n=1 Tax=Rotaria socialis TaxID=392032 RepID=A0A818CVH6_9BILA|nr:unnamed protein product [Rotaria socialis]CAF3393111.1 unnamed protein product [Rotaria socialis]CAF3397801.1 unnamed protein product [Rotaria socialis]CAF3433986.1 unnamed protein product [Rotaria socialis]CAF3599381.1 unnamed protein product [Rotaria socialis]
MDELSLILQSLIDSEIDDMILDLVYEIHSSIKGIPQEQFQINNYANKNISIEKQTCICPNCGQSNLIATKFSYHLAKCLGAGRQSSRRAKRRIVDQIMIIAASDKNGSDRNHFDKDIENNSISEDGSSCTDSTSSSMTLISSNQIHNSLANETEKYFDEFDDDDEDDWKPKMKKQRVTKSNHKKKMKKNKDVLVVVSSSTSKLNFGKSIIPLSKLCPVTNHVVMPLVSRPIGSVTPSDSDKIIFKTQQVSSSSFSCESSNYFIQSPLNLVEDEQSSIIVFKEDIK